MTNKRKPRVFMVLFVLGLVAWSGNAQQTIRLATIEWEPYTGQALAGIGFLSEIVKEAFDRVNYKVEFVYLPWPRALSETTDGRYDGLMDAYRWDPFRNGIGGRIKSFGPEN